MSKDLASRRKHLGTKQAFRILGAHVILSLPVVPAVIWSHERIEAYCVRTRGYEPRMWFPDGA
jgi:hypothetical protein